MSKKLKDLNEHNAQVSSMQWAMNDNVTQIRLVAYK